MHTNKTNFTAVQITDTHLFCDRTKELMGYCTHQRLSKTIDHILDSDIGPDIVLATGDISQDETAESYALAAEQFARLGCPVYWIQGNHDNEQQISATFDDLQHLKKLSTFATPTWDFISINTCRVGTDKGYIEDQEYDTFLSKIEQSKQNGKSIAVVMHHHPIPVNTPLIDDYILEEHQRFLDLAGQHKEIKLVICGHVHGDYKVPYSEFLVESCPATCFQWKKGTQEMAIENAMGYKIFNFGDSSYSSSTVIV